MNIDTQIQYMLLTSLQANPPQAQRWAAAHYVDLQSATTPHALALALLNALGARLPAPPGPAGPQAALLAALHHRHQVRRCKMTTSIRIRLHSSYQPSLTAVLGWICVDLRAA